MKTIATARPNKNYINYRNLRDTIIEARIIGGQVRFYELRSGTEIKCLTQDLVKSLFSQNKLISDRPFLEKENPQFYAILYRNRKSNQETFTRLINHQIHIL